MRKQTLVIAGLALLSTNAFASKARIEALSGNNGAAGLYINDNANVFRNAAVINTHKNYVVTEWGSAGTSAFNNATPVAADGTIGDDSQTSPRAEGGFFKDAGSLSYGLYLGNDGKNSDRLTTGGANGTNGIGFLRQDNALDLFIGGDTGLQWGARVHYASSKDEPGGAGITRKNTAFGLGLGVIAGAAEGYLNVDLSDKSEGRTGTGGLASDEWKQKPTFTVGGSYDLAGTTVFAEVTNGKAEQTTGAGAAKSTGTAKTMNFRVGAGHVMEISPTARIIGDASVDRTSLKSESGGTTDKYTTLTMPVTIGFEADATSWLTLRGSVGQNVILNQNKEEIGGTPSTTSKNTIANTTTVNGGATLNFGKLAVDGLIGTTSSDGAAGTKTGVLSTDNLLTRVGVTYNF